MKALRVLVTAALLAFASVLVHAGEIVDRLVAAVDSVPILQSDWDQAVAFEALQQGRAPASFSPQERRAVLDRLVDQQLLRAQMGDVEVADSEERDVAKTIEKMRGLYPNAATDEGWRQLLQGYDLDEELLREKVSSQLAALRFVNLRLRPESRISAADVEAYYNNTFVPQVRQHGENPEPLAKVSQKISEILREQRMDALLNTWLRDLRSHSQIDWQAEPADADVKALTPANSDGGR